MEAFPFLFLDLEAAFFDDVKAAFVVVVFLMTLQEHSPKLGVFCFSDDVEAELLFFFCCFF